MKQCRPASQVTRVRHGCTATCRLDRTGGGERGFATVIVLILIFVMLALLVANNRVLSLLKQDLQRVEERQTLQSKGPNSANAVRPTEP